MKTRIYKEVVYREIRYAEIDVPEGLWDKTVKPADGLDWVVLYPPKMTWQGIVSRENIEGRTSKPHYEEPHA